MGERIQQIAGILMALAFVAILLTMNSNVIQYGKNVNKKMETTLTMTDNYELGSFNETTVTGDTVISTINNAKSLGNIKLKVTVDGTEYGYLDSGEYIKYSSISINPNDLYYSTLDKNDNNVTIGVIFEKK